MPSDRLAEIIALPKSENRRVRLLGDRPLTQYEKTLRWQALHPEESKKRMKQRNRKSLLKRKYGLTPEGYEHILRHQNGVCAICRGTCPTKKLVRTDKKTGKKTEHERRMAIDHDHVTGVIRGLLCVRCNIMIGNALDNPMLLRAAAEYLERSQR